MIQRAQRRLRRAMDGATHLIDSTGLALNERSAGWARFSAQACGAKLHVVYDASAEHPLWCPCARGHLFDKQRRQRCGRDHRCVRQLC